MRKPVFLPVWKEGALFSIGDAHIAQGDGEVCGSAIEMRDLLSPIFSAQGRGTRAQKSVAFIFPDPANGIGAALLRYQRALNAWGRSEESQDATPAARNALEAMIA